MNIGIRAFVKTPQRLALTRRTLESLAAKALHRPGRVGIVNGAPEYNDALQGLSTELFGDAQAQFGTGLDYEFHPCGLMQGFVDSLQQAEANFAPALLCTDDLIFGRGTREALRQIEHEAIPALENAGMRWGVISLFACYPRGTPLTGQPLFELPASGFYGGIAMILNPELACFLLSEWGRVLRGEQPPPDCLEDIWINRTMTAHGFRWFNTLADYAWHNGNDARVAVAGGAQYQTQHFIGE